MARCGFVVSLSSPVPIRRCFLLSLLVLVSSTFLFSQSQPPVRDPQAIALAAQAMTALTTGTTIGDMTLSGTVTRTAGSDKEIGTATLYAKGQDESRIDMSLSGGQRKEIRNSSAGYSQGQWVDANGTGHGFSSNNCSTDAVWFFPALSSLSAWSNSDLGFSYIGLETLNGVSVQHLRLAWSGDTLSSTDFYLDSSSLLPIKISFNAHPDKDANVNIPVVVLFSNYQNVSGVLVPYRVQQYFNGVLLLDFTLSGAAVNSGLADSLFQIQ